MERHWESLGFLRLVESPESREYLECQRELGVLGCQEHQKAREFQGCQEHQKVRESQECQERLMEMESLEDRRWAEGSHPVLQDRLMGQGSRELHRLEEQVHQMGLEVHQKGSLGSLQVRLKGLGSRQLGKACQHLQSGRGEDQLNEMGVEDVHRLEHQLEHLGSLGCLQLEE